MSVCFCGWPPPPAAGAEQCCAKFSNPKAASWAAADIWQDAAWSSNAAAHVVAPSPAQEAIRAAIHASAKLLQAPPLAVDVISTLSGHGTLALLAGRDLRWALAKSKPGITASEQWAAELVAGVAPGLGLASGLDALYLLAQPSQNAKLQGRWIARWGRQHQGIPVLGDELLVHADGQGRILYLQAHMSDLGASLATTQVAAQTLASGAVLAWVPPALSGRSLELGSVESLSSTSWTDLPSGQVFGSATQPWVGFDAVVTTRAAGATPVDHECYQSNLTPRQCADTGRKAWILPENGVPTCVSAVSNGCNSPQVVLGRNNAVAMRTGLAAFGITDYEPSVAGGPVAPLVISPHAGTIPDPNISPACDLQNSNQLACLNPAVDCRGDVDASFCAIAFRPTGALFVPPPPLPPPPTGNSVTCGAALGPVKGAILMSDASHAALDVMTHEFGHLWLAGHGFPVIDANIAAGQPAVLHEAISDGLALAVDTQNWAVGDGTECSSYRSACWPGCAGMPNFTQDPGCAPPANAPPCKADQPRLWQDYALKVAKNELVLATHHNTGILNYAWFLIGSDGIHDVGGSPDVLGQGIAGQGRSVLGQLLASWPSFWTANIPAPGGGNSPTFDGLQVTLTAAAQAMGPNVADTVKRAFSAVGLWRTDARSQLFGVGRVAAFSHSDGAGAMLEYAVNWDGLRAFDASRCLVGEGACTMQSSITIGDPTWPDAFRPSGPPAVVDVAPDRSVLYYPNPQGQLWTQNVVQGDFQVPADSGVLPAGALSAGLGVGTAWDPTWGGQENTVIAYVCATPACTCGGLKQPGEKLICAQDLAGTWFQVVDQLAGIQRFCDGLVPLVPPIDLPDTVAPLHEPNIALLGNSMVITWADKSVSLPDGSWRVHYRVAKRENGGWQWGAAKPWLTKGDLTNLDLPARTNRSHSLGLMPGAGGWSAIDADNTDRVSIQYSPVNYPDLACAADARYYAFASAALATDGLDLAEFSMGVAQNEGIDNWLTPLQGMTANFVRDHGAAGASHRAARRTYAWIRRPALADEPKHPSYGIDPIPDYGPLLVKSTSWR